jgi:hypothetical protein
MTTMVCNAMNVSSGAEVTFSYSGAAIGSSGSVVLEAPVNSLTGFATLPFANAVYPDEFTETVDFRLEQPATWVSGTGGTCP